jgi:UDP-N-acetylglucosamine pyrophosphorylase
MIERTKNTVAREVDKLNENEAFAALDYISEIVSTRKPKSKDNQTTNDDLIVSLSDAYENKRARQVFEWEKARRQNVQRAA